MRRKDADRRSRPRFEIVGELWGTVETVLSLPLRDVGLKGVLVESHLPLAVDSVHRLAWEADRRESSAQVRVRHVEPVAGADGEQTFLIGFEFVVPNPVVTEQIQRWLVETSSQGPSGVPK